jgi:hypothetical protein
VLCEWTNVWRDGEGEEGMRRASAEIHFAVSLPNEYIALGQASLQ